MTVARDFVYLTITEEEYRQILKYTEQHLSHEWMVKYDDRTFGQDLDPNKMNPNAIGILGECVLGKKEGISVQETLDNRPIKESDPGWDIVIGGLKYDIKTLTSPKGRRPTPRFRYNIKEKDITANKPNDGYLWVAMIKYAVNPSMPWYWLGVGWMLKVEFLEKADFHKTGDKSVTGNDFVYSSPTYDIPISELHPYKDLPR